MIKREIVTKINKPGFAYRMRNLRKIKGLNQIELAERVGVTNNTISLWEDEAAPQLPRSLEKMLVLCYELDTKPYYLLCGLFDERTFSETEKAYKDIYARFKSNAGFRIALECLMLFDDREVESFASFFESIYSRPLSRRR